MELLFNGPFSPFLFQYRYERDTIADRLSGSGHSNHRDFSNNNNVDVVAARHSSVINQQILTLKLITTKLNHAYNGLDVEWQDNGEAE